MLGFRSRERSQAMPEFALVAPILFLIIFGVIDFGRGIIDYVTIQSAANEAARVLIQGEPTVGSGTPYSPGSSLDALQAAQKDSAAIKLVPGGSSGCYNGPINTSPAVGVGNIFVTDPLTPPFPAGATGKPNGTSTDSSINGCWAVTKSASEHYPLQVTIVYNFQPLTYKFLGIPSNITLTAWSVYDTEY